MGISNKLGDIEEYIRKNYKSENDKAYANDGVKDAIKLTYGSDEDKNYFKQLLNETINFNRVDVRHPYWNTLMRALQTFENQDEFKRLINKLPNEKLHLLKTVSSFPENYFANWIKARKSAAGNRRRTI